MRIKREWEKGTIDFDKNMIWAAAVTCFFGFLRAGEICVPAQGEFDAGAHLMVSDIAVDCKLNPAAIQVRIKASKTDPFREGCNVYMGRTGGPLCPWQ